MEVIIFHAAGAKQDLRLEVLGRYFMVHSTVMRKQSKFFSKFLDSPDKTKPVNPPASGIIYDWATMVDSDGCWSLVESSSLKNPNRPDHGPYRGRRGEQLAAFDKLLRAIYNAPFVFDSVDELALMTQLADYYFALPALSRALRSAMLRNPFNLAQDAVLGLQIGNKLRNADLVRDCVCYLSGRWNIQPDLQALDPRLRALVHKARGGIFTKLGIAHSNVMAATTRDYSARVPLSYIYDNLPTHASLPQFYHDIHNLNTTVGFPCYGDVSILMVNNLKLVRDTVSPGLGSHSHYFLCAEVSDEDLPWDTTQLEW